MRLSLWLTCACAVHCSGLLSHVARYEVVTPRRLPTRQKRSLQDSQLYPDSVRYELTIEGRNHTIHLEKNRDLIARGYTETHYSEDGERVTTSPNEEHCYYHGHVEGVDDSSVSVGICSGISGFVRAQQRVYLIEPLGESEHGQHAVYRKEDLKLSGRPSCGSKDNDTTPYDREDSKDQRHEPPLAALFRSKSQKPSVVADPQQLFVELYVVVDSTEYNRYGAETRPRILGAVNHIDKLYRPLGIRVMLVGLEIWSRDRIDVDVNSELTLDRFLLWRQTDLLQRTQHDTAQLVTGKDFEGDTVGLANKYAMCSESSGGVNQDHHANAIGLASTIAHEMGHNFGLSHDTTWCVCGSSYTSGNCVMADKLRTRSEDFPEFFSNCSLAQLAEFLERAQPSCLSRPSSSIAVGPLCGNGLVDPGEECDCGTEEECENFCCNASTCRLTEGSQCAHGQCCDSCQFRQAGGVCRKASGTCDLPEYCTGTSAHCPEDEFEMNGKPCYNQAQGFCYDGQCPTHEQHCWRLFGPGTKVGMDWCFGLNRKGEKGANCGRSRYGFTPCTAANQRCGSMFCEGGGQSITGKHAAYTYGLCRLAMDDDKRRNINMVPQGTKCGADKVCLDNRCVDVSVYGTKEGCDKKCNNNGVCNHKKECHCNPGFAPPNCAVRFADIPPEDQDVLIPAVCAVVSILLVVTVVIVALMCCRRKSVDNYTSKRKVHSAPGRLNPIFQDPSTKDRPQISQPMLVESTATQACSPLMVAVTPCRPAPQPPSKPSPVSPRAQTEPTKPRPPSKPSLPVSQTQLKAAKPAPPPVPPVKPSPPPPLPPAAAARAKPCTPPLPPAKPRVHRLT